MKIGLRAHDYGKMSLEERYKRIHEDGFQGIQLAVTKVVDEVASYADVNDEMIAHINQLGEKYEVEIPVLGCYVELGKTNPEERQQEVNKFLRGIECAKAVNAHCIGSETTRFNGTDEERRVAFEGLVDSVKQIVAKAEEVGVNVAIEPVAVHTLNTPELAKELLERVPSDHLKIIFDPVNLLTAENIKDQDALWDRCFECFGHKICALHMKGIKVGAEGQLEKASLQDNAANFKKVIDWLKVNQPEITILREEINPAEAKEDWAYMHSFL